MVSIFVYCFFNWVNFVATSINYVRVLFISKPLVAFLKNLLSSSETKWSSKIVFSLLSTKVILLLIFRFCEKKGWIFFQKLLLVTDPSSIKTFEIFFPLFFGKPAAVILLFLNFFLMNEEFFSWNKLFPSMTVSWWLSLKS